VARFLQQIGENDLALVELTEVAATVRGQGIPYMLDALNLLVYVNYAHLTICSIVWDFTFAKPLVLAHSG
jgi:hypothetical protein